MLGLLILSAFRPGKTFTADPGQSQAAVGGPSGSDRLPRRFEPRPIPRLTFRQSQAYRRMLIFSLSSLTKTYTRV